MDIKALAAEYGVKNIRIFHPMQRLQYDGLIPGIAFRSASVEYDMVECEIVETRYKVDDGYKVTLKAVDEAYGLKHFYQSDLETNIHTNPDHHRVFFVSIDGYHQVPNSMFDWRKKA
jgi:hypothetical protein